MPRASGADLNGIRLVCLALFVVLTPPYIMPDLQDLPTLDASPTAAQIAEMREKAAAEGESVQAVLPTDADVPKRLVVSPRGTCVLLQDTREESFNPSVDAADIAEALSGALSE